MTTFKSKRGTGLIVLFLALDALFIGLLLTFLSMRNALLPAVVVLVVLGFSITLIGWTFAATDYTIRGEVLAIRSGPFHWDIDIRKIESVRPSFEAHSAPALSLDRLAIVYAGIGTTKEMLVSPEDPQGFIRALRVVNPKIAADS